MTEGYDWFHLRFPKPVRWKILHPFQARKVKKWLVYVEGRLKAELEKTNYNAKIEELMLDCISFGTSHPEAVVSSFEGMVKDIIKKELKRNDDQKGSHPLA